MPRSARCWPSPDRWRPIGPTRPSPTSRPSSRNATPPRPMPRARASPCPPSTVPRGSSGTPSSFPSSRRAPCRFASRRPIPGRWPRNGGCCTSGSRAPAATSSCRGRQAGSARRDLRVGRARHDSSPSCGRTPVARPRGHGRLRFRSRSPSSARRTSRSWPGSSTGAASGPARMASPPTSWPTTRRSPPSPPAGPPTWSHCSECPGSVSARSRCTATTSSVSYGESDRNRASSDHHRSSSAMSWSSRTALPMRLLSS